MGRRRASHFRYCFRVTKHDDGARERSGVSATAELQPALEEPHLAESGMAVPPIRVYTRRHETNDGRTILRGLIRLAHPGTDRSAVGRIHPADARPVLRQPVHLG